MLYEAMARADPSTGLARGYLRLAANPRPESVLFTLDIGGVNPWKPAEEWVRIVAPRVVEEAAHAGAADAKALVGGLLASAPLDSISAFVAVRFASEACAQDRCVPHSVRQLVLTELRGMPLNQVGGELGVQALGH